MTVLRYLAERSKAIRGAGVAVAAALALVVVGNETFADVTTAEWIFVALALLGTGAVVERSPNTAPAATGRHASGE